MQPLHSSLHFIELATLEIYICCFNNGKIIPESFVVTLVILRIDLLVAKTVSIEYWELVEMVWSEWYQVALANVEFVSQVSLTVSPSKMFEGCTVNFVWSGKTESNILHYCHFSSHLYGVFPLMGVSGASQLTCTLHQLQGTTSDTSHGIFPQHILLVSFSAKGSRMFYAES